MDIKIKFKKADLNFDLVFANNDLATDAGLESAVIVSLFSDRRISDDELPPGQTDKKGWWGDAVDPTQNDLTGSKLWLLAREKQTEEVLQRAQEYAEQALQWLLDDGVASVVKVSTSYPQDGSILISADITRPDKIVVSYAFNIIWEGQANAV
jgi:phage gp46-like protein